MNSNLITPAELWLRLGDPKCVVVDCRFDLLAPAAGETAYRAGHVPGAVYLNLQTDLSGPDAPARGRHPMPEQRALEQTLARAGIGSEHQIVAYDNNNGTAARLWWLLRYLGHDAASVLDGGWPSWLAAKAPVATALPLRAPAVLRTRIQPDRLVTMTQIDPGMALVDAREEVRFLGVSESFDPRPGRIPGARNRYWRNNLDVAGRLLDPAHLAAHWRATLGYAPGHDTVHYCGSGVTACVNALAQVVAGYALPRVYIGSYSEWCRAGQPIATG